MADRPGVGQPSPDRVREGVARLEGSVASDQAAEGAPMHQSRGPSTGEDHAAHVLRRLHEGIRCCRVPAHDVQRRLCFHPPGHVEGQGHAAEIPVGAELRASSGNRWLACRTDRCSRVGDCYQQLHLLVGFGHRYSLDSLSGTQVPSFCGQQDCRDPRRNSAGAMASRPRKAESCG